MRERFECFPEELLFFLHYVDGHFDGHVFVQPHRHLELAELFDGLFELNLAPVDFEALRRQGVSGV
jgi:hypothetical protein